jgi:amidophosphoribosyltransferase
MIKYPCYMGIDFPSRSELIASNKDEKEIAKILGADSIEYLTVDEMKQAIGRDSLCTACFTGIYPLKRNYSLQVMESVFNR